MKTIERRETFEAPVEEVWAMLTRPELLQEWFGAEVVELALQPGGRVAFKEPDGRIRRALVQSVDPPKNLSFRWLPFVLGDAGDMMRIPGTTVEFFLAPTREGTQLTVVEWGFADEDDRPTVTLPLLTPRHDPPGAPPRFMARA